MITVRPEYSKTSLEERGLIGRRTQAVFDPEFTKALSDIPWKEWLSHSPPFNCREEYLQRYDLWIHQTKLNSIQGLERFSERELINGTTQAFDEYFLRYSRRRLRFFRGEYAYHRRVVSRWMFVEEAPLDKEDALIVSWPFCSTGAEHPSLKELLDQALELRVPVLIDAAYFGTCHRLSFDFSHPAIEAVCFSLTKGLGLGDIRSGIRYSCYQDDFPIRQQNKFNHSVLVAAKVGLFMMDRFSSDFIPMKYGSLQEDLCQKAGLVPTPCMHLALGIGQTWDDYRIDGAYNRVGIRELLKARRKKLI